MMDTRALYKPALFFLIAYIVSWILWFADAYFSWHGGSEGLQVLLIFLGICGPFAAAIIMFWKTKSPELWSDYRDRLFSLKRINLRTLPLILFLFPALLYVAIGISFLLGKSPEQLTVLLVSPVLTLPGLMAIFVAPVLEEAGWRGYGVDSLRSRSTLFVTSVSFGLLWAFWHTPLFFINAFYHNTLLSSWLFTINFFASAVVLAFIINWIFYRNNRSIIACIIFHLSVDLSGSFIPAEQFTKCIVTVLLLIIAAALVIGDRKLWFVEPAPTLVT